MLEALLSVSGNFSQDWLEGIYTQLANPPVSRSTFAFQTIGSKSYAFGGSYGGTLNNSMSVYDHITGQWSTVSQVNAPTPRCAMSSCVHKGKLYMFGGQINGSTVGTGASTAESYVFDPTTSSWSAIASMPTASQWGAAASLGDLIYIAGGYVTTMTTQINNVYEYNPTTNTYRALAALPQASNGHGMVGIKDALYLFGGVNANGVQDRFLKYNPTANSWLSLPATPFKNTYSAYAVINDHICVFGGSQNNTVAYNFLQEYSPLTNKWLNRPTGAPARHSAGMAAYNGKAYLLSGSSGTNGVLINDFWQIE